MSNTADLMRNMDALLGKIGSSSLEDCAQIFLSAQTADIYILAGEAHLEKLNENRSSMDEEDQLNLLWEAFHQFSMTHATLYLQRHKQKLLRQSCSNKKKKALSSDGLSGMHSEPDTACLQMASSPEDTRALLSALPDGWTVVQITAGVGCEGSASRLLHMPPSHHVLHIARVPAGSINKSHGQLVMQTIENCDDLLVQEMESIKEQNRVINKAYADNVSKYSTMREHLDNKLRGVVRGLECSWLGVWRFLLSGALPPQLQSDVMDAVSAAATVANVSLSSTQRYLLMLAVSCPAVELSPHDDKTKKAALDVQVAFPAQLRVVVGAVLQDSVRSAGVKRLSEALAGHSGCFKAARSAARGPLILILDKAVVSMPWEAMSCMRRQPVTRMPSLLSLHALYTDNTRKQDSIVVEDIDCSKGFYVLDPESNLPRTQQRLAAAFQATAWPGVCATKPSHDQFKLALATSDAFMYVGHGSGSQYLPGDLVEEVQCHACVMLYGCSSVRLQPRGFIPDPWGVLLNYLLAASPCVVGMLWEVTDKDTDLLTGAMLDRMRAVRIGNCEEPLDLPSIIAASRPMCNRFVTAAAIVVYGLPCSFKMPS